MALLNHLLREVNAKIVYIGPEGSGKQTSLAYICRSLDPDIRSSLKALTVQGNRMLFFNFCPAFNQLEGYSVRFHLYTVPGKVHMPSTWKVALKGVDGVVFVADSDPDRQQENLDMLSELQGLLALEGAGSDYIPFVVQYNRRDLPEAVPLEELQRTLNRDNVPGFPTVSSRGEGVHAPLSCLTKMILANIKDRVEVEVAEAEAEALLAAEAEKQANVEAEAQAQAADEAQAKAERQVEAERKATAEAEARAEAEAEAAAAKAWAEAEAEEAALLEEMEFDLSDETSDSPFQPEDKPEIEEGEDFAAEPSEREFEPLEESPLSFPEEEEEEEEKEEEKEEEEVEVGEDETAFSAPPLAGGAGEIRLGISGGGQLEDGALTIPVTVTVGEEQREFRLVISLAALEPLG